MPEPSTTSPPVRALPGGCLYEQKFHGYRAVAFHANGRACLQSRRGTDLTGAFPDVAEYASSMIGIEGLVIKGRDQPYRGGQRGWLKYRYRDTHEVIVGAVTGTHPQT